MKFDIDHVAKLANLTLTDTEKKKLLSQLEDTVDYVEELEEVDTKGVDPISQVTGLENVLRDDIVGKSFTQEEALQNAKSTHNGFFRVKGILEND